ncbi:MAG: hypothetical protein JXR07_03800 [Reichenbachiella sp.]
MQLIWYNSIDRRYEYGSAKEYKSLKSNSNNAEAYTILMEFTGDDKSLANKIIGELNIANDEKMKMAM